VDNSGEGNVISGNGTHGLIIVGINSAGTGNEVRGNTIRLNANAGVVVDADSTLIVGNLIFQNGSEGVAVAADAQRVRISANQIFANGALGINLAGGTQNGFGVTANDNDDPDTGANNLQNFPVLASAIRSSNGVTNVAGSLNSNPNVQFRIELFLVLAADASGHGEGQILWAVQNVTTNSGGNRGFTFQVGGLSQGQILTATATSVTAGNTSEFSANVTVIPVP
jgi:hypothetical protein